MGSIVDMLTSALTRSGDDYARDRLHYGADLDPSKCARATWYAVHLPAEDRDPVPAGRLAMWWLGNKAEDLWYEILSTDAAGEPVEVLRQVALQPLRPSAWAFAPMHLDLVVVARRHLYEIKAPSADKFDRAGRDARALVRESYRWQLSAYFHEAKARGIVDTASWIFVDRTEDGEPLEVMLEGDLLVPLSEIVAAEESKAHLVTDLEPPPRLASKLKLRVWKTKDRVEAHEERSWQCRWCAFEGVCQPGPEDRIVDSESIPTASIKLAVSHARIAWAGGSKKTPQDVAIHDCNALLPGSRSIDALAQTMIDLAALEERTPPTTGACPATKHVTPGASLGDSSSTPGEIDPQTRALGVAPSSPPSSPTPSAPTLPVATAGTSTDPIKAACAALPLPPCDEFGRAAW